MVLHYDTIQKGAVGTTADAIETVGTFILNKFAKRVVGFIFADTLDGTTTTAEATLGRFFLDSADLAITGFEVPGDLSVGGAPGTQTQGIATPLKVLPVLFTGSFNNARITVKYAASDPEPTSDIAVMATVIYDDGTTPQDIIDKLWDDGLPWTNDWRMANEGAGGSTASLEMDDSPVTIPSRFSKVVAFKATTSPDAVLTDAEEYLAYIKITSSVPGLEPMKVPFAALSSALIGTAVGQGIVIPPVTLPLYIDKGKNNETFDLTQVALAATTGAIAYNVGLGSRF